ncbi:MAG: Gfo/Idh/MocA family oxidoreductase [Isosphaeraceae bacterium]|nr:Gfo/Idh/MocA family oxidoreductase [Isosphaeraceae bacterium]
MSHSSRRSFLKLSTGIMAVSGLSERPARVARAGANETVVLAMMGVRGRAGDLMRGFAAMDGVRIKTLIDVDSRLFDKAVAEVEQRQGTRPETVFGDFRRVLDDKDIDALVVGTPDHWHAIPTVLACQAGKHVYVEKPDAHNIREGRLMVAAARKYNRVVQMGVQSRSGAHFAEAVDYLKSGAIGRALYARAWESTRQGSIGKPPDAPVPDGVDYDTWLGPAPKRPFNPVRFHGNWRWFFDYGTGDLGNDGVHRLDYARRGLEAALMARGGKPLGMPTVASATGGKRYFDDLQEFPDTLFVSLDYPDQQATILYEMRVWTPYKLDGEPEGAAIFGDRGYVIIGNSSWRACDPAGRIIAQGASPGAQHDQAHKKDFIACLRSGRRPNCDIAIGHTTSVLCHLGNIAWRVGRTIRFDPETETILDDPEANALRARQYRSPWVLQDDI